MSLYLDAFFKADGHDGSFDLVDSRSIKPQIQTIVGERADFLRLSVVTHGDDRDVSLFDELNQFLHSSAVLVARHSVHFVHDQAVFSPAGFLSGAFDVIDDGVVVQGLGDDLLQRLLTALIRGVEFHESEAQFLGNKSRRRRLPDARRTGQKCGSQAASVVFGSGAPARSANRKRVRSSVPFVPIGKPVLKLPHVGPVALLTDDLLQVFRLVFVDP